MPFHLKVTARKHTSAGQPYGTMLFISGEYNLLKEPESGQYVGAFRKNNTPYLLITLKLPPRYQQSVTRLFESNLFGRIEWKTVCWLGRMDTSGKGLRIYLPKRLQEHITTKVQTPGEYDAELLRDDADLQYPAYALAINLSTFTPVED